MRAALRNLRPFRLPSLLALAILAGCAQAKTEAPTAAEAPPAASSPEPVAVAESPTPAPTATAAAPAARPFEPPFPQRDERFVPPDLSSLSRAPVRVEGRDVVVRGFVNFEGPKVVLEIDGEVRVLAEGDQHRGVEVLSIAPPEVNLQSDSRRWTM